MMKLTQEYFNPEVKEENEAQASIEVSFKFPKTENTVLSKLLITVGEKTIEAKVMDK